MNKGHSSLTMAFSQRNNAVGSIWYQWYSWDDLLEPTVRQKGLADEACEPAQHGERIGNSVLGRAGG